MFNPMDLSGKRILVTGASSGIGQTCALHAARLGASVILVARNQSRLKETLLMLPGDHHILLPFDLKDLDSYKNLFTDCTSDQKLDGFIHAAGIAPAAPIKFVSTQVMQDVMDVNFFSFLELVKWFSKKKYSNGGSVVGISSVSSFTGWPGGALYGGSKAAMDSAVRSLALELATRTIRVNSVVPSNIQTPMLDELLSVADDEARQEVIDKQPLGIGEPEDVAHAATFLLSDAARFITGTQLVVDGGYLAQ